MTDDERRHGIDDTGGDDTGGDEALIERAQKDPDFREIAELLEESKKAVRDAQTKAELLKRHLTG